MFKHVVLGGVVGLVVGAAAVGIPWLTSGGEPDRSSATLACDALHQAEPVDARDDKDTHLMGAAEQLSLAAVIEDKAKQPLADAIKQVSTLVFYEGQPADSPKLRAAVAAADKQCAG